jgi:Gpi18-like mannosyltransferase
MKKVVLVCILISALVILLSGCNITPVSAYDKEILEGSVLDYEDMDALSENWETAQGGEGGYSAFTAIPKEDGGGVRINTTNTGGWAYIAQKVLLKRNSYYKISYEFSSSSMSKFDEEKEYIGFFAGFLEDPDFNIGSDSPIEELASTSGKKTVTFYFHTKNINEAHLALRVGTEDNPVNASNVTINSVSLTRVKSAEAAASQPAPFELSSNVFGAATRLNAPYVIAGGILTLVIIYIAYVLLRRAMAYEDKEILKGKLERFASGKYFVPIVVLAAVFAIRLAVTIAMSVVAAGKETLLLGFEAEKIIEQGLYIAKYGPGFLHKHVETLGFMPLQYYLSTAVGLLLRLFKSEGGALGFFLIKFISILADLGAVYIIYNVAEKKFSKTASATFALAYGLLPAVFALSGVYANWNSVNVLLILLTFYFMLSKNLLGLGISYFLCLLATPYSIILAPVVLMYLVYVVIGDKTKLLPIGIGIAAAVVLFYLAGLPFVINEVAKGKAFAMFTRYIETLKLNNFYTVNAFNFQALLNNNLQEITTESTFITILFKILFLGLLGVVLFKNKNRLDYVLGAGMYLALMVVFTNRMDQYSIYMLVPITLLGGITTKDKRLMASAVLYSAVLLVNIVYVSSVLGYDDTGYRLIENRAMLTVFGALSVITAFLHFFTVYDIIVSRQARVVEPMTSTYPQRLASVARLIGAKWQLAVSKIKGLFKKG